MADDNEPQFIIHQDTQMYITEPIHFQLVQMNKSMFVWVGKQQANMKDLSIAMPPTGTQVHIYKNMSLIMSYFTNPGPLSLLLILHDSCSRYLP